MPGVAGARAEGPGPTADPFGTERWRSLVLQAWAATPARFREDANAEEDAAVGGYRDRLVVELAQNAADAAARAGVVGELLLRLVEDGPHGTLLAANTGAPLDAAGVQGLATLRASDKRDPAAFGLVGRFGVGFTAVLAVAEEVRIGSGTGSVGFSAAATRQAVAGRADPGLDAEVRARGGHVPVLRLPFPTDPVPVPAGYDTAVVLPLRDGAARALVEGLLTAADDVLLLALPQLASVRIEVPGTPPRRLEAVEQRWHLLRRSGSHPPERLAGRPTEERRRLGWQLTWALPRETGSTPAGVLCAPTPTDDPLPWPATLLLTVPLGPDRRRVADSPATTAVLGEAARAYVDLLVGLAAEGWTGTADVGAPPEAVDLLPHGVPADRRDAELRELVLDAAREVPLLRAVEEVDGLPMTVRPADAVALQGLGADDPALLAALAPVLAGLVPAPRHREPLLRRLGVNRLSLAEALELLPTTRPEDLGPLYRALAGTAHDPTAREALSGLPVPLADGRTVHGARGLLLPAPGTDLAPEDAVVLAGHGLRLVEPGTAQDFGDLLERLGARRPGAVGLLDEPAVRAAVLASPDADDPDAVVAAVLGLVEAALPAPGSVPDAERTRAAREIAADRPWLGDLALPDAGDDLAPASALVLPGSPAADDLDPDETAEVAPDLLADRGAAVLEAVGVRGGTALVRRARLDLADPDELAAARDEGFAAVGAYARAVWADVLEDRDRTLPGAEEAVVELAVAVRDLDLLRSPDPATLLRLASTPAGVEALTRPWRVAGRERPGLTAWWWRRHGPLPAVSRTPDGGPDWLPLAPAWTADLPAAVRPALGVRHLPGPWRPAAHDVLDLLAAAVAALRSGTPVPARDTLLLWAALAAHADDLPAPGPPPDLPVAEGTGSRLVRAGDVVLADSPAWAQRTDLGHVVAVAAGRAEALADLLDLDLTSDRADGDVAAHGGRPVEVPVEVQLLLPDAPPTLVRADGVRVDGVPVGWWVRGTGRGAEVWAGDRAGAAAGLALAAGAWAGRHAVADLLAEDPARRAAALVAELPGFGALAGP
ncbi:sacsin N-terminal ATP-binding-like domain-containing protein [Kineococcus gynurae]|uniref:Sacsin N-terminal ATP-binding-like domain-containing protein n=1 Tax=Kineococcus gynurae TaxID=452979 RepID=A0ABV5LWJ1_9ACTN